MVDHGKNLRFVPFTCSLKSMILPANPVFGNKGLCCISFITFLRTVFEMRSNDPSEQFCLEM